MVNVAIVDLPAKEFVNKDRLHNKSKLFKSHTIKIGRAHV